MITKAKINDKIYDVIKFDEYVASPEKYSYGYTAISEGDTVFPIRNKTDTRPGVYPGPVFSKFIHPLEEEKDEYSIDNIIDFDNAESIKDIISAQDKLRSAEKTILTTIDNVFIPTIDENDYPEMVGLKEAVIAKKIDLDKYEQRFGINYNNDKRLFNKNTITMSKLKTMLNALDMKASLIIEDKDPDVPNPIGKRIVVELTGSSNSDNSEEDNLE